MGASGGEGTWGSSSLAGAAAAAALALPLFFFGIWQGRLGHSLSREHFELGARASRKIERSSEEGQKSSIGAHPLSRWALALGNRAAALQPYLSVES